MKSVDTNVLFRLLMEDDLSQTEASEAFVDGGVWVSTLALAEAIWVLKINYRADPSEISASVAMMLQNDRLVLQDPETVAAALSLYRSRPALGFTDCLILELARKAGHLPLGTFDRNLAKADGAQKV